MIEERKSQESKANEVSAASTAAKERKEKQKDQSSEMEIIQQEGRKKKLSEKMEKVRSEKLALAEKFKEEVLKYYGKIAKAVIVFGSLVRGDFHEKSDIDMLVVIDDVMARLSPEQKLDLDDDIYAIGKKISPDISVQPAWTLSEFWDMARIGHPLLYTIVRDGWALYDTGFFVPVRKLLELGKIPTTLEAVERFMETAPKKIRRVDETKLYMVAEDLYYSVLNSSQAVLMFLGENPPTPKETLNLVKERLVDEKLLEREYYEYFEQIINFRKGVEHREINTIKGEDLDEFIDKANRYVERMQQLLARLQERRKESMVEKNYEVLIKATVAALKKIDKLPPDPKDLPMALKDYIIGKGHVDPYYSDVFKKVVTMRKLLDEKRTHEIPQREIELMREYVRRFVRDVAPLIDQSGKVSEGELEEGKDEKK
ncbi:MAG: nucleotidyltransferase domain-containing protein [Candidatus Aenigmarchaeota archaeon]|nr:nucleotidyltransferase domain-containing protein [Candidatus Aenigmarchaeota archaeon]